MKKKACRAHYRKVLYEVEVTSWIFEKFQTKQKARRALSKGFKWSKSYVSKFWEVSNEKEGMSRIIKKF